MARVSSVGLYDEAAVRALDAQTVRRAGNSGLKLMVRAGTDAYGELKRRWPRSNRITVVCGSGNNAGDGYVVARLAKADSRSVRVLQLGTLNSLGDDARACLEAMIADGIEVVSELSSLDNADIVVDAIFGIGLSRPIRGDLAAAIELINAARAAVMSLDIPSGIHASTGARLGTAVRADLTVTFIASKQGLYTGDGPAFTGHIVLCDLGVDDASEPQIEPQIKATARLLDASYIDATMAPRERTAHKGDHGHVLLIGGAPGYGGAIRLAGEASARVGSGLVSVAAHPKVADYVNIQRPELMVHRAAQPSDISGLLKRVNCVAIGPGLGQQAWSAALLGAVLPLRLPLVVDADALNLLAAEPTKRDNWVLTPHPGEAARLLGVTTAEIKADRFNAALRLQQMYGGCVVLKGAGSIVFDGDLMAVVGAGNPGMATGGMGDVLTGIIAGLIAQGFPAAEAARLGTCVHAVAGDYAARRGERGLLASDLFEHIRTLVN
jgi:NAD(P)H-hydrate epimerase